MNDAIMDIAKTYMRWHDNEHDFGVDESLCRSEIHTIQTIGNNEGLNITQLAKMLDVTKPTISERINKLSKIKLVVKKSNDMNNKEVVLFLTEKGWVAYQNHEKKHRKLYSLFEDYFGNKTSLFLTSFMEGLDVFSEFLMVVKKQKDFS